MKSKTKLICVFVSILVATLTCYLLYNSQPNESPEHSIQEKFEFDDASLDKLVLEGASMLDLIQKYGEPVKIINRDEEQLVYFLVYVPETAPPKAGRIGFTAVIRDGKIVEWMESTIQ